MACLLSTMSTIGVLGGAGRDAMKSSNRIYKIEGLPMWIYRNKKGQKWYLNLNTYRNTHNQSANRFKGRFCSMLADMYDFKEIPFPPPYHFTYVLRFATRTRVDVMNYGAILDKFVSDALVEFGLIVDDDRKVISKVTFEDGGVVPGDRSADLIITPYLKQGG